MIRRKGSQWILYTHDGSRVLGRHASRAGALAQERAIYAAKARRNPTRKVLLKVRYADKDERTTPRLYLFETDRMADDEGTPIAPAWIWWFNRPTSSGQKIVQTHSLIRSVWAQETDGSWIGWVGWRKQFPEIHESQWDAIVATDGTIKWKHRPTEDLDALIDQFIEWSSMSLPEGDYTVEMPVVYGARANPRRRRRRR